MKKIFSSHSSLYKVVGLVTLMTAIVTLSSCDPDRILEPDFGPEIDLNFVGSWELVAINSTPIYPEEYTTFDFWQNGSGNYGFYVNGRWYNQPLSWTTSYDGYGYTMLYVNSSQGYFTYEVSYISPNTMILVDTYTDNQLEYQRY